MKAWVVIGENMRWQTQPFQWIISWFLWHVTQPRRGDGGRCKRLFKRRGEVWMTDVTLPLKASRTREGRYNRRSWDLREDRCWNRPAKDVKKIWEDCSRIGSVYITSVKKKGRTMEVVIEVVTCKLKEKYYPLHMSKTRSYYHILSKSNIM